MNFYFQSAGVVCPLVSTVVASTSDGFMKEALDRTKYCGTETPQAFNKQMIIDAYKQVGPQLNS